METLKTASVPSTRRPVTSKGHKTGLQGTKQEALSDVHVLPSGTLSKTAASRAQRLRRISTNGHRVWALPLGYILSLIMLIIAFRIPMSLSEQMDQYVMSEQQVVQVEEILQTEQAKAPPPPARPTIPVVVPNDALIADDDLDLDALLDIDESVTFVPPPPAPVQEEVEEEEIFVVVEDMPSIIGGTAALYDLIDYPEIARAAGVEGLVVIQVTVEPDGRPSNPVVARGVAQVLDEEAVRAVMALRFNPGRQRGRAVRVNFAIPVRFRLRASG